MAEGKLLLALRAAGELGYITVDFDQPVTCGKKGCLETVASATGIVSNSSVC